MKPAREFLRLDDVRALLDDRGVAAVQRLTGGSKKGVYRLRWADGSTAILYAWTPAENYWPPAPAVPDDPFTDASGAELFATSHAALTAAGVRVPRLLKFDPAAEFALVEDAGSVTLEEAMEDEPLARLGDQLRRLHTTFGPHYGKPADIAKGSASQSRRPEDIIVDRALTQLELAAGRDKRLGDARERIADHVRKLRAPVPARRTYALVHGELGPDHVLIAPDGDPVLIDIEGLAYFDVEWEHAFLQLRFDEAYPKLCPVDLEPHRLELYRYAQVLALIEGPLRIADTDFPDRRWMLDLAEYNIRKALGPLSAPAPRAAGG